MYQMYFFFLLQDAKNKKDELLDVKPIFRIKIIMHLGRCQNSWHLLLLWAIEFSMLF